jgi:hypothetical protein
MFRGTESIVRWKRMQARPLPMQTFHMLKRALRQGRHPRGGEGRMIFAYSATVYFITLVADAPRMFSQSDHTTPAHRSP